jgi:hypothetical protein
MTKDIFYKLGFSSKKYWWILIIAGLLFYFWPQDYFKNCIKDHRRAVNNAGNKYNEKEDKQGSVLVCEKIKKSNPDLFREYKGEIFTKTTLFVHR